MGDFLWHSRRQQALVRLESPIMFCALAAALFFCISGFVLPYWSDSTQCWKFVGKADVFPVYTHVAKLIGLQLTRFLELFSLYPNFEKFAPALP